MEGKTTPGGDKRSADHSAKSPNGISVSDAGFKGARDAKIPIETIGQRARRRKKAKENNDFTNVNPESIKTELEAERKMGEMLSRGQEIGMVRAPGRYPKSNTGELLEIADLGLTKRESAEAQMLASISQEEYDNFERAKIYGQEIVSRVTESLETSPLRARCWPLRRNWEEYWNLD